MEQNFGKIMAVLAVLILIPIIVTVVKKIKKWAGDVKCAMSEK